VAEEQSGFQVRGSVQGVGCRWWTQRKAVELGLRGAVMNLGDGSVEVHVAGSPEVIAALARWLGQGPPGSRVRSVEMVPSLLPIPTDGFIIEG